MKQKILYSHSMHSVKIVALDNNSIIAEVGGKLMGWLNESAVPVPLVQSPVDEVADLEKEIVSGAILARSGNGEMLFSLGAEKKINIWILKTADWKHAVPHEHMNLANKNSPGQLADVTSMACTQDGKNLFLWMSNGELQKLVFGEEWYLLRREVIGVGLNQKVTSMVITADDKFLVCGDETGQLGLFSIEEKRMILLFKGHDAKITSLAYGKILASGSLDKNVKIWDVTTGSCIQALPHKFPVNSIAIRGNDIVVASGRDLIIWSPDTVF